MLCIYYYFIIKAAEEKFNTDGKGFSPHFKRPGPQESNNPLILPWITSSAVVSGIMEEILLVQKKMVSRMLHYEPSS